MRLHGHWWGLSPLLYSIRYILHIITWKCFFRYCLCQDPWVARALSIFNGAEIWMVNIELIAIFQFELCSCGYGGTRISSINSFFFLFFKRHESVILRNLRLFLPCFFLMRDISFGKYSPEWITQKYILLLLCKFLFTINVLIIIYFI